MSGANGDSVAFMRRRDAQLARSLLHVRSATASGLALDPTFNLGSFRTVELSDDRFYFAWRERRSRRDAKGGRAGRLNSSEHRIEF
jgi:hypothetical protein